MDVFFLKLLIIDSYFTHCLVCLLLKLAVVEIDQLIAEAIDVAAEAALARQHIIIVVDIFVEEGAIL